MLQRTWRNADNAPRLAVIGLHSGIERTIGIDLLVFNPNRFNHANPLCLFR